MQWPTVVAESNAGSTVPGWLASVAAIIALVISVATYFGAKHEARKARLEAKRSADAAERSALAEERMLALAQAEAERDDVAWDLASVSSSSYLLTNTSQRGSAYKVRIDGMAIRRVAQGRLEHEVIGPGEAVKFLASKALGMGDRPATVTWYSKIDHQGEQRSWSHPLV